MNGKRKYFQNNTKKVQAASQINKQTSKQTPQHHTMQKKERRNTSHQACVCVYVYCQPYHGDLLEFYPIWHGVRERDRALAGRIIGGEWWDRIVHISLAFRVLRITRQSDKKTNSSNKSMSNSIASLDSNLDCIYGQTHTHTIMNI